MVIALIGSCGKMGYWLTSKLAEDKFSMILADRNEERLQELKSEFGCEVTTDNREAVKKADTVILAVPIAGFEEVAQGISSVVEPGHTVIDISSVKMMPLSVMHAHLNTTNIVATHPLFGPGSDSFENQKVAFTPTSEAEEKASEKVSAYLEGKGARCIRFTPDEHDSMMSVVLGLAHFISLVSADTLSSFNKAGKFRAIAGCTYSVLITLIESVVSEDPDLYAYLQMNLPEMSDIQRLFQAKAWEWHQLARSKDHDRFVEKMVSVRDTLAESDPLFGEAYNSMYKMFQAL